MNVFSIRILNYLGLPSATVHVDFPQNGVNSHDLPGSTVAHLVDAKHIPGKSKIIFREWKEKYYWNCFSSVC